MTNSRVAALVAVVVTALVVMLGGAWVREQRREHARQEIVDALLVGCLEAAKLEINVEAATNRCLDQYAGGLQAQMQATRDTFEPEVKP